MNDISSESYWTDLYGNASKSNISKLLTSRYSTWTGSNNSDADLKSLIFIQLYIYIHLYIYLYIYNGSNIVYFFNVLLYYISEHTGIGNRIGNRELELISLIIYANMHIILTFHIWGTKSPHISRLRQIKSSCVHV